MFSEWIDPNDINNYYDDIEKLFKAGGIVARVPSVTTSVVPAAAVAPAAVAPVAVAPVAVAPVAPLAAPKPAIPAATAPTSQTAQATQPIKQGFDVLPNSIFDNRSVGHQPEYNILRSGAPVAEKYCNRRGVPFFRHQEQEDRKWECSTMYLVLIFIALLLVLIHTRMQLLQTQTILQLILRQSRAREDKLDKK